MKQLRVTCDEETMDRVSDVVLSCGGSIPANFVIQLETVKMIGFVERWLVHAGIDYEETRVDHEAHKHPDLIASHVALTTFSDQRWDC